MAKGAIAKQAVVKKIQEAFQSDFIGEIDKKVYVWAQENGERVQIALSLTCPKVPVATDSVPTASGGGDWNFEDSPLTFAPKAATAEITDEERQRVDDLMKKLGL